MLCLVAYIMLELSPKVHSGFYVVFFFHQLNQICLISFVNMRSLNPNIICDFLFSCMNHKIH